MKNEQRAESEPGKKRERPALLIYAFQAVVLGVEREGSPAEEGHGIESLWI